MSSYFAWQDESVELNFEAHDDVLTYINNETIQRVFLIVLYVNRTQDDLLEKSTEFFSTKYSFPCIDFAAVYLSGSMSLAQEKFLVVLASKVRCLTVTLDAKIEESTERAILNVISKLSNQLRKIVFSGFSWSFSQLFSSLSALFSNSSLMNIEIIIKGMHFSEQEGEKLACLIKQSSIVDRIEIDAQNMDLNVWKKNWNPSNIVEILKIYQRNTSKLEGTDVTSVVENCSKLSKVCVSGMSFDPVVVKSIFESIATCSRIADFEFEVEYVDPKFIEHAYGLLTSSSLKRLKIWRCTAENVSIPNLEYLTCVLNDGEHILGNNPSLRSLSILDFRNVHLAPFLRQFSSCQSNLQYLSLPGSFVSDEVIITLFEILKDNKELQTLKAWVDLESSEQVLAVADYLEVNSGGLEIMDLTALQKSELCGSFRCRKEAIRMLEGLGLNSHVYSFTFSRFIVPPQTLLKTSIVSNSKLVDVVFNNKYHMAKVQNILQGNRWIFQKECRFALAYKMCSLKSSGVLDRNLLQMIVKMSANAVW
jgi:hypothetical protein